MNNVANNKFCYGCGVCAASCPVNAIDMKYNAEGFYEPFVDSNTCIDCGMCASVCSFNKEMVLNDDAFVIKSYASWSCDESIRLKCSSGGIAYTISEYLLNKGYNVCAVKYDVENESARHYIADSKEGLKDSIGSKYLQSNSVIGLKSIDYNKKNLIIGTPCMIDSYRRLLRRKHCEDNFILIDFFCHGVPSVLLWKKYLKIKKRELGKINAVYWRTSNSGWHNSLKMRIEGDKDVYEGGIYQGDVFYKLFLHDYCLGKACYLNCKYKMASSAADIRIGDLWGRAYQSSKDGVSALLTVTKRGEDVISNMSSLFLKKEDLLVVTEGQMANAPRMPYLRSVLLKLLARNTYNMCIEILLVTLDIYYKKIIKLLTNPMVVVGNRLKHYKL